ncbi:MAG: PIN domain-containing protein [Defluviitaleaceae bacterium]|nr:PIN domain-containing protein [Defluviitaleaceae bacterium]
MNSLVYLDNCCFNRPYDNQLHPLVKIETQAKLVIQQKIIEGEIDLVWSFILYFENSKNPFAERKNQILLWKDIAKYSVSLQEDTRSKAAGIMKLGINLKDALHIACAIQAGADCFITTDKKLLNKTMKELSILNPVDFLRRHYDGD